ncbi:MAG: MarR family transcriptional regulator [Nitrospirae bacterium]|nr:MarR family transcriptional regulator [Nitrospirota bacterium]
MIKYEEEILISVRRIMRAIDRQSSYLIKNFGLTTPQLLCLKYIASEGPLSPGHLSQKINLSHATVTGIVNRLEKKGLIKKQPNKKDGRSVLLSVTKRGQSLLKESPPMLHEYFIKELSQLQDWEKTFILSALQKIVSILDAEEIKAAPILTTGPIEAEKD